MAHWGLCEVNVTANISLIINEIRWYWQICHYFWQLFIFYIDIVCVIVCGKLRETGILNVSTLPASNITSTSYTANWEYLPKALGYYVQPYRFDVVEEATTTNTIEEKFSKSTEGTTDQPVNVTQENLDEYTDCAGWSGRNISGRLS